MAACWEEPMTAVPFPDTLSQHSHPERRTCHAVSSPLPRVTPGVNLPRYYTLSLRLSLSPLLYFFSSCRSLSGFSRVRLCLCLSICVFICFAHIHRRRMPLSRLHRLSRQWEEINPRPAPSTDFQESTWNTETHGILHMLDYSGAKTQSKVNSYWHWYMLRKRLSLQGLPFDLRLILQVKSGKMEQLSNVCGIYGH